MDFANRTKSLNLRKLDSTVLLERSESPTGAYVRHDKTRASQSEMEQGGAAGETPVGIDLSIRFGRVFVLMVLAVAALVTVSLFFNRGFELGRYDPNAYDADGQKQLVDDYNSYTGTVASVFGRPIEMFITIAVHLVLMRVMAASLLSPEVGWKTSALTLIATTAVSFLIMNSLNALNVQPLEPEVKAVISAVDLTYVPDLSNSDAALRTTNLTQTFSERSPKNPLTNTALRNLVLPRVPLAKALCLPINRNDVNDAPPDIVQEYGFSQRDWQSRLLQEAIEPTTLRVVVNPSDKTAKQSFNLPMDAAVAADLFVYSMVIAPYMFPWAEIPTFVDSNNLTGKIESVARATKLLPPLTPAQDETAQREWFIRESAKMLSQRLATAKNLVRSDVAMEFSHVDISKSVHFDAVTIDFQVDPKRVGATFANGNSTWTNSVSNMNCGPWPLRCMMRNPIRKELIDVTKESYDAPAQVQVFGVCVNDDGKEELSYLETFAMTSGIYELFHCPKTSNKSLMVVSIAKRFEADAVTQSKGEVTKLRRIYSLTMAKLSWDASDLGADFDATCAAGDGACKGLRFPLDPSSADATLKQELIVGVDALPTKLLTPMVVVPEFQTTWRFMPLVVLQEPTPRFHSAGGSEWGAFSIDPLLPHNVAKVSWNLQAPIDPMLCNGLLENTIQLVLDNHLYIEHGLQTAYTAATFYLLQNAVVKDVISLRNNKTSLNFQQNELSVALWASIPDLNVWLTLGGCGLLVVSLLLVMLWACITSKSNTGSRVGGLGEVTTPHVVARIMLDAESFPPTFLHRRVIGTEGSDGQKAASVEGYLIDGLALQPPPRDPKA